LDQHRTEPPETQEELDKYGKSEKLFGAHLEPRPRAQQRGYGGHAERDRIDPSPAQAGQTAYDLGDVQTADACVHADDHRRNSLRILSLNLPYWRVRQPRNHRISPVDTFSLSFTPV